MGRWVKIVIIALDVALSCLLPLVSLFSRSEFRLPFLLQRLFFLPRVRPVSPATLGCSNSEFQTTLLQVAPLSIAAACLLSICDSVGRVFIIAKGEEEEGRFSHSSLQGRYAGEPRLSSGRDEWESIKEGGRR